MEIIFYKKPGKYDFEIKFFTLFYNKYKFSLIYIYLFISYFIVMGYDLMD